jgi:hypothetical protein
MHRGRPALWRASMFVLCALALAARGWFRLVRPQLFAEDGQVFLTEAYAFGWTSLWRPYAGYHHLAPRIVALAMRSLPLQVVPTVIAVLCLLALAWSLSEPADTRFKGLWATAALQALVSVALCFMPGLHEVLGNLANLHAVAALWLVLLGSRGRGAPLRWPERVAIPFATFTAGESVVLLPLFAFRSLAARFRGSGQADDRAVAIWLALAAAANLAARGASLPAPGVGEPVSPLRAILHAEVFGLWLGPLLGYAGLQRAWEAAPALCLLVAAAAASALLAAAIRLWHTDFGPLSLGVACAALVPVLTVLVRPGAPTALGDRPHAEFAWARYAFQVAPLGFLAWTALLARWPRATAPWPAAVLAALSLFLAPPSWRINRWDAPRWREALEAARNDPAHGCSASPDGLARISTAPRGWFVSVPRAALCNR